MRKLGFVLAAACLLAVAPPTGTGTAWSRALSEAESLSLAETVERFDAAMRASDFETVSQTIPPKVMEHIATKAGVDVAALRGVVIAQMRQALAEVKIVSFGMDLAKAQHRELDDGTPYVLIPTETVVDAGKDVGRTAMRSDTLALLDNGNWYLLRVSELEQVAILRQVYPGFAGVEFSAGTMEAVK